MTAVERQNVLVCTVHLQALRAVFGCCCYRPMALPSIAVSSATTFLHPVVHSEQLQAAASAGGPTLQLLCSEWRL